MDPVAEAAANPSTDGRTLASICDQRPELRPIVAANPAVPPPLASWLGGLGDPAVNEALARRPHGSTPSAAQPMTPVPAAYSQQPQQPQPIVAHISSAPQPHPIVAQVPAAPPAQPHPNQFAAQVPSAQQPYQQPYPQHQQPSQPLVTHPYPQQPKPRRTGGIVAAIIAVVLVVAGAGVGGFLLLTKDDQSPSDATSSSTASAAPSVEADVTPPTPMLRPYAAQPTAMVVSPALEELDAYAWFLGKADGQWILESSMFLYMMDPGTGSVTWSAPRTGTCTMTGASDLYCVDREDATSTIVTRIDPGTGAAVGSYDVGVAPNNVVVRDDAIFIIADVDEWPTLLKASLDGVVEWTRPLEFTGGTGDGQKVARPSGLLQSCGDALIAQVDFDVTVAVLLGVDGETRYQSEYALRPLTCDEEHGVVISISESTATGGDVVGLNGDVILDPKSELAAYVIGNQAVTYASNNIHLRPLSGGDDPTASYDCSSRCWPLGTVGTTTFIGTDEGLVGLDSRTLEAQWTNDTIPADDLPRFEQFTDGERMILWSRNGYTAINPDGSVAWSMAAIDDWSYSSRFMDGYLATQLAGELTVYAPNGTLTDGTPAYQETTP